MRIRIRKKGQITIPSEIRTMLHLSKGSILSIAKVGNGIFLTPKLPVFESFASKFSKEAEEKGISFEDMLKDLRKIRRSK